MSCFSLPNKLKQLPSSSKKAWKSFTSSLSPKLHRLRDNGLNLPKSFSRTATRLLHLRHKRRGSIPRPPTRDTRSHNYYKQYNYQHLQPYSSGPNSPATVYIDRLFEERSSCSTSKEAKIMGETKEVSSSTSGGMLKDVDGTKKREKVGNNNNWKEYISSMPNIRGVDERAEEFISKFRQEMQLQREQSIIDIQEMLARSA